MDYKETLEWMFAQLPMYQKQGASAYRKDLTNTILLTDYLANPEKSLKCIHVAGTNGKGSVSHMLASIFMEAGYKVGLFTSPHLKDYRERIKVNGKMIPEDFVVEFIDKHRDFFESNNLSFFEMSTGLAFDYFKKKEADICIIETGMGGRLDSTNIITPLVSVITNIGLDHTQFLGETLGQIATEKAGIMKRGIPVVIGQYTNETKPVFLNKAKVESSEIYFASDLVTETLPSDLKGDYQKHNIKTVMQTVEIVRKYYPGFALLQQAIASGLRNVVKNTGLSGRWQQLQENPKIICDTAHNYDGLRQTMWQVASESFEKLHVVLGVVNDKDLSILELFPTNAIYYFCRPDIPRGLDARTLFQEAAKAGLNGKVYGSVPEAYQAALGSAGKNDFIYVGGSTFVVAEIL